jgi:hypothetical protein
MPYQNIDVTLSAADLQAVKDAFAYGRSFRSLSTSPSMNEELLSNWAPTACRSSKMP